MMLGFILAISSESFERPLLISLIIILGIILYIKLIRNLKQNRLNKSFSYISGYDREGDEIVIHYTFSQPETTTFSFSRTDKSILKEVPVEHAVPGDYSLSVSLESSDEFVYLTVITSNQKINKKIYLHPES